MSTSASREAEPPPASRYSPIGASHSTPNDAVLKSLEVEQEQLAILDEHVAVDAGILTANREIPSERLNCLLSVSGVGAEQPDGQH